jgi:Spy/CpxP family protein refolding chaperone
MKKFGYMTIVMVMASMLTTFAFAKGPGGMPGGMGGCGDINMEAFSKLDLTKEQTDKIRTLRQTHHQNIMPLWIKTFEKRAELKLLWMQLEPDVTKIKKVQKELRNVMEEIDDKSVDFRLDMRKVLTSDQLSRYLALKNEEKFHHGYGPMRGAQGKDDRRGPKGPHHGRGYMAP